MPIGRPKSELVLNEDERVQLSSLAGSRSLPHAIVARAKVVLWSVEGVSNSEIATRLQWSNATVGKWRRRFIERRLPGLYDELRPGRPRSVEDEKIAKLLKRTIASKPKTGTHWTVRDAAQVSGISKSTVHRLFQAFAVQPHRTSCSGGGFCWRKAARPDTPSRSAIFIIAATALQHGPTVVTRDRRDFDKAKAPVFNPSEQ